MVFEKEKGGYKKLCNTDAEQNNNRRYGMRRIISLLLSICLMLGLCPEKVMANDSSESIEMSNDTNEGWKKAYLDYINENGKIYDELFGTYREEYKLVNVNGDEIPELYINFGSIADGSVLCSYYDNSVIEQRMYSSGFSYIEGENLFMDSGGHMDVYYKFYI